MDIRVTTFVSHLTQYWNVLTWFNGPSVRVFCLSDMIHLTQYQSILLWFINCSSLLDHGWLPLSQEKQRSMKRRRGQPRWRCSREQFAESQKLNVEWNWMKWNGVEWNGMECWRIRNNCHYCCQYWHRPSYTQSDSHFWILTTNGFSNNNNQMKYQLIN